LPNVHPDHQGNIGHLLGEYKKNWDQAPKREFQVSHSTDSLIEMQVQTVIKNLDYMVELADNQDIVM